MANAVAGMSKTGSFGKDGISDDDAFLTLSQAGVAMVLTNPNLADNPIVYVNDDFLAVTGYPRESIIGHNCRFLQGERTDPDHVRALREAIAGGREVAVDILNYRADGSSFRNRLLVSPVHDAQGRVNYFLGIQKALSSDESRRAQAIVGNEAMREVQHRVKNHLAMIVGLIRLQSRSSTAKDEHEALARRVESVQLLYEELNQADFGRELGLIGLGAYLGRICGGVAHLDGRPGIRVAVDMAALDAPVEAAARIGLILSEVVTNAFRHAFVGRTQGFLDVRLEPLGDRGVRVVVLDDGVGLPNGVTWPDMGSMGGRIVAGLVDGLAATLRVRSGGSGTQVTLEVPDTLSVA